MSFILYVLVLVASVSSVLLGLDWLASPPQTWRPVEVARQQKPATPAKPAETKSVAVKSPTVKKSEARVAATPATTTAGTSKSDAIATAEVKTPTDDEPIITGANPAVPEGNTQAAALDTAAEPDNSAVSPMAAAASAVPACDVRACESAYRSFRASDCTYQPFEGPRRFCDKGTPPSASTARTTLGAVSARAQASACNVQACANAYQSFNPADCTYQPYDGPRQLCTK